MSDIIARLEKATGPDRDMDADIARQNGWAEHAGDNWIGPHGQIAVPAYTSSIDAALTLVPDECDLEIYFDTKKGRMPDTWLSWLVKAVTRDGKYIIGKSNHGAIALCIAALKARSAVTTAERATETQD